MKKIKPVITVLLSFIFYVNAFCQDSKQVDKPVNIQVDFSRETGKMEPVWAWFGYDEPNYTYMKDGKKLLSELSALSPVPVYVRAHNLLTTGDGTPALKWGSTNAYTEDKKVQLLS